MKSFGKIILLLILAAGLLGAGVYLSLANVSRLLAAGAPRWQCRRLASGLLIKTGKWNEKIDWRIPIQVTHRTGFWVIRSNNLWVTVMTKPRFNLQWKKSFSGRRFPAAGEY